MSKKIAISENYSQYTTHDGVKVHYLDIGQGPAILFGHSYLWNHQMWQEQVATLSIQYRCIVPDLWGHGKSGPLPKSYESIEDLANSYHQFMEKIGINTYIIVGLSVGGMWGTHLASLYPQKVKGLVIMDSYLGIEQEETKQQYLDLINMVKNGFTENVAKNVAPLFFKTNDPDKILIEECEKNLMKFDKTTQIPSIVKLGKIIFNRSNAMNKLIDIKNAGVHIEIVVGEKDGPRPPSEAEEMANLIGKISIKIKDAGHIPTVEQPKETTTILAGIIKDMVTVNDEL